MAVAGLDLLIQLRDEASQGLSSIADQVGGLGTLTAGLATGGVALLTGALVGAGMAGFNLASDAAQGVNDLQAQLGLTEQEAQALGDVALEVFGNNFGESLPDVTAALADVRSQMRGLSDGELQDVTESALAMRDVFGTDVPEVTNAANTLMQQFGLTGQEAMDFITKGFQSGLNSSDDFLDSIGEYSTQLSSGGASAEEFFSLMQSGLQGGMLGTDKAADAFKEFRVRIQDGSTLTRDSLKMIGIDSDKLAAQMASGQVTAADAFNLVTGKLREVKDENVLMQAGVGLLGTQFEDLGTAGALALDLTKTSMEDLAGATDSLNAKYDNLSSVFSGAWRSFQADVLAPLGTDLLGLANEVMPTVQAGFAWVGDQLPGWFATARGAVSEIWTVLQEGIAVAESLLAPFQSIIDTIQMGRDVGLSWGEIFSTVLPLVLEQLGSLRESLFAWINESLPGWITGLQGFVQPTVQWILDALPGLLANLAIFAQGAIDALVTYLPQWGATLLEFGIKAVSWIADQLPALADNLSQFFNTMVNWVVDSLPGWAENLAALGAKATGWVLDALPGLGANLGTMLGKLLSWIAQTIIEVTPKLLSLAMKFVEWVATTVIPALPGVLATIATALWNFITATTNEAGPKILELARKFYTWVQETVIPALPGALEAIKSTIGGWISGALAWASAQAAQIGSNIIQGIKNGVAAGVGSLRDAVTNAANEALNAAKQALGISSPSRKMAEQVGKPMAQGIEKGFTDASGGIDAALADKLADLGKSLGDAVSSMASGFGAAGDVQLPMREKLQAIAQALRDTVADFWHEAQGVLYALKDDRVTQFADVASKTVGLIGTALSSFEKIKDFAGVPADAFETVGTAIADALVEVAFLAREFADQGLDKAAEFAQAAGQIVGLFKVGADTLGGLEPIAAIPGEVFESIGAAIADALVEISFLAREFADQGIPAAAAFAESAGKVIQVIGAAVTAFGGLNDYRDVAPERMRALAADMEEASRLMLDIAARANTEGLENAAAFAQAMQSVFELFKTGVAALDAIRDYQAVPVDRMTAVLADFDMALRIMLQVVAGADQQGVPIAAKFAAAASQIFDAMKAAIEALDAIREYQAVPAERFAAFEIDFGVALTLMDRIWKASEMLLWKGEDWQKRMEQVRDSINAGIDALKSIKKADEALAGSYIPGEPSGGQQQQGFTFGGMRALGGSVREGLAYEVGERGRELFVPNTGGSIVPKSALVGQPVYITIDARGSSNERAVEDAGYRGAKRALKEVGYRAEDLQRVRR